MITLATQPRLDMIVLQSFFISGEVFASGSMTWLSRCLNELMIDASVNGLAIDAPKSFEDGSADHGGLETSSKEIPRWWTIPPHWSCHVM